MVEKADDVEVSTRHSEGRSLGSGVGGDSGVERGGARWGRRMKEFLADGKAQ